MVTKRCHLQPPEFKVPRGCENGWDRKRKSNISRAREKRGREKPVLQKNGGQRGENGNAERVFPWRGSCSRRANPPRAPSRWRLHAPCAPDPAARGHSCEGCLVPEAPHGARSGRLPVDTPLASLSLSPSMRCAQRLRRHHRVITRIEKTFAEGPLLSVSETK